MLTTTDAHAKLEESLASTDDVFVAAGVDRSKYLSKLIEDIRSCACEPFWVRAKVLEPAFPFAKAGETIAGYCVAFARGCWLVYQPDAVRFLCFWGESSSTLGAHGIYGSAL